MEAHDAPLLKDEDWMRQLVCESCEKDNRVCKPSNIPGKCELCRKNKLKCSNEREYLLARAHKVAQLFEKRAATFPYSLSKKMGRRPQPRDNKQSGSTQLPEPGAGDISDVDEDAPDPVQEEVSGRLQRRVGDLERRNRELRQQMQDYHELQSLYKEANDDLKGERLNREKMQKKYEEKLEVMQYERDQAVASSTPESCKQLGTDDAIRNEKLWYQVHNLVGDLVDARDIANVATNTLGVVTGELIFIADMLARRAESAPPGYGSFFRDAIDDISAITDTAYKAVEDVTRVSFPRLGAFQRCKPLSAEEFGEEKRKRTQDFDDLVIGRPDESSVESEERSSKRRRT